MAEDSLCLHVLSTAAGDPGTKGYLSARRNLFSGMDDGDRIDAAVRRIGASSSSGAALSDNHPQLEFHRPCPSVAEDHGLADKFGLGLLLANGRFARRVQLVRATL
jgi:hypothetical protein